MADTEVEVRDVATESRYEARIDGELAGFATYRLAADRIVFTHTEVDDAYEGHGVGSALARGALDDVAAKGERSVLPLCSFIKGWIDKHPDYQRLVVEEGDGADETDESDESDESGGAQDA